MHIFRESILRQAFLIRSIQSMCSQHFKSVTVVIMMISYASRQDAEEQYQKAEELYEEVKAFLEK